MTTAQLEARLRNLLRTQFRLGFYNERDTLPPWATLNASAIDSAAHRQLAREAAEQGLVLLKLDVPPSDGAPQIH